MFAAVIGLWVSVAAAQVGPEVEVSPTIAVLARGQGGYTEGLSTGLLHGNHVFTRARVGLEMARGTVSGRVVLQHVLDWRAVSTETYPPIYERLPPRLDLVEGWGRLEARVPGGIALDITFGRMLFTLHEGRLISENDWLVAARPIDGMHVRLLMGTFQFQYLHFRDFSDLEALRDPGSVLVTLGSRRENPAKSHTFDFVLFTEQVETDFRLTTGPYYTRQSGRFDLTLEAYFQFEDHQVTPQGDTIHGLASARAGWTFGPERLAHVVARYDVYSSPFSEVEPQVLGGWTAPLGDVYAFYGHMNLFQNPEDTDRRGLQDLSVAVTVNPRPRLQLELDLHHFWTAKDVVPLGFEADGTVRAWLAPFASAQLGYAVFVPSPGLDEVTPLRGPYGSGYLELGVHF